MPKIKIIAICGKAGAGKDTLLREINARYKVHPVISCTTRPRRENEQEGKDYFFFTKEQFAQKLIQDQILEATEFNGWFYGTPKDGIDESAWNIGVFNPEGIEFLMSNPEIDAYVFYIDVSDKERLLRQLNREQNPDVKEIIRRFGTDEKDFQEIDAGLVSLTHIENKTEDDLDLAVRTVATFCRLEVKSD